MGYPTKTDTHTNTKCYFSSSLTNRRLEETKPNKQTNTSKSALLNPFIDFCAYM